MDSITYSPYVNTLFFFFFSPQRQLGDGKGGDRETLKDTPKRTGVTPSSAKQTLNQTQPEKFTSVCGGFWTKATARSATLTGNGCTLIWVSVPKAEISEGSGERKCRGQTRLSHGEGKSRLCLNDGRCMWLPLARSWTANLQADVLLRWCMWQRWRRAQTQTLTQDEKGLHAWLDVPGPVHVLFFTSPTKCTSLPGLQGTTT